jgi:hypothetical protein
VLAQFEGDGFGQMNDRALGDAVEVRRVAGADTRNAGGGDDRARSLRLHQWGDVLHAEEHALEQHIHGEVVVGRGRLDGTQGAAEACVVEEHVDPPETIDGLGHHGGDVFLLGHIGPQECGVGAEFRRQRVAFPLIEIGDQNLGALLDEATNGPRADTTRATGDRGDLALEAAHVFPPWSPASL